MLLIKIILFRNWAFFSGLTAIFVSAIVCSFLYAISYPPPPSGLPISERNYSGTTTEQNLANDAERGADKVPFPVTIVPGPKRRRN
jgi:hypothetical protein